MKVGHGEREEGIPGYGRVTHMCDFVCLIDLLGSILGKCNMLLAGACVKV